MFRRIRDSIEYEPGRTIAEQVFRTFKDPDGNFVEQFQTSGFDARIFELYLHAYFESSGYVISRARSNPDFILTRQGVTVAVEATTSNPSGGAQSLQNFGKRPNSAGITRAERKLPREMPIRLGSPLFSKLKKEVLGTPALQESAFRHCNRSVSRSVRIIFYQFSPRPVSLRPTNFSQVDEGGGDVSGTSGH